MAGGGLSFLLLRSLYLMTLVFINTGWCVNLFREVRFASARRRRLAAIRYVAQSALLVTVLAGLGNAFYLVL